MENMSLLLQTQQEVLAAGDDTLDQEYFPQVFLLGCHVLKMHVRFHPREQAAEELR